MNDGVSNNPFKVGDVVQFEPNDRAIGWSESSMEQMRLAPRDTGTVTRISNDNYLYLDGDRGGFHWQCFKKAPK